MESLLEHPAVQAGILPLVVSLIVAAILARTRVAWLGIVAGYAAVVAITTGFSFSPLSASRKVMLLVLLAPLCGIAVDLAAKARARWFAPTAALAAAACAVWAFSSVLGQRELAEAMGLGLGVAAFTAALVWGVTRLAGDGVAVGAAGLGLGLATGISALLSASTGYFMGGVALAAASGALLLLQFVSRNALAAGAIGTLSIGVGAALFADATLLMAQLPWYALPLMLLPVLLASLPFARGAGTPGRVVALSLPAIAGAAMPAIAAWISATSAG